MSQALQSLRLALERATAPADVALARMRYAIYLARMGDNERAKAEIGLLRSMAAAGLQAECTARANLAEGVLLHCNFEWEASLDKLHRATALSSFAGSKELNNLANAWSAHIVLNLGRYEEFPPFADKVLANTGPDEHSAISRLSVSIGVALQSADCLESSKVWYEIARRHAVTDQDDVTIEAILFALPAFRIHHLFTAEITSSVSSEDVARARMELDSSLHYFGAKGWPGNQWMHPRLRMHLLLLEGRFAEAKAAGEEWLAEHGPHAPSRYRWDVVLDLAYCVAKVGDVESSIRYESDFLDQSPALSEPHEQAQMSFRRAQLAHLRGDTELHERLMKESLDSLAAYRRDQEQQRRALDGLQPPAAWL